MKCAYCYSEQVKVVSSYSTRDVTVIECLDCGKTSEIDVENSDVDTDVANHQEPSGGRP